MIRTNSAFSVQLSTLTQSSLLGPQSLLFLLTLLALALRLYCLDCYGLWYDEVASVEIARRGPWAVITDRFGGMLVQTPLHYLQVWLTLLPGDPASSAVWVRLPSVLAGTLTLPVVYGLGRMMFGQAAALVAALLLMVSPVHIGYSQDARPYALLVLFTAISVYCLLRAEREEGAEMSRWWWGFAGSTALAIHTSYFGLTLFLPALSSYLAWVLYRAWRRGSLRAALAPVAAIAIASVPIAWDVLRVERASPDPSLLINEVKLLLDQFALLPMTLAKIGLGGLAEAWAQWGLFGLALVGAIWGRARYVALCALMLIIPALELALFKTTNQVFQRYALFVLPFYLLLMGNGLALLWLGVVGRRALILHPSIRNIFAGAISAVVAMMFALGAYLYFNPAEHRRFSYLPDYRGAAQYLAEVAEPGDIIVLVDEPALGAEVMNFYWRGSPPTLARDARDPRLRADIPAGDIFWVISFFQNDPAFMRDLPLFDPRWREAARFERILVLREERPGPPLVGLSRLVELMRMVAPTLQPVQTLSGVVLQAEGQGRDAAVLYSGAGAYYRGLGGEFLVSAQGFLARGDKPKAWREAITSFFMQPGDPRIHELMSQMLLDEGYRAESELARQVAQRLRTKSDDSSLRSSSGW